MLSFLSLWEGVCIQQQNWGKKVEDTRWTPGRVLWEHLCPLRGPSLEGVNIPENLSASPVPLSDGISVAVTGMATQRSAALSMSVAFFLRLAGSDRAARGVSLESLATLLLKTIKLSVYILGHTSLHRV